MIAQITFETGWMLVFGLPIVLCALAMLARHRRQQGDGWQRIAWLIIPRSITLLVLLLLASRPVFVTPEVDIPERKRIVVLLDQSESMSIDEQQESRWRQAVDFLRDELLPNLQRQALHVDAFLFAEDVQSVTGPQIAATQPDGRQTNLGRAITRSVGAETEPPLAIVALTDGIATLTEDNPRGATALIQNRVPFYGIAFGEETGASILTLDEWETPSVVSPRDEFPLAVRLRKTETAEDISFGLTLFRDGQLVDEKTVSVGSEPRVWQESFSRVEQTEGYATYTVRILPPDSQSLRCPRPEATAGIRIVGQDQMRILFVQGGLTWDYKFIRIATSPDPTIRFTSLSRAATGSTFVQNESEADPENEGFPTTIEQLAAYHVVVLSNLRPRDLPTVQQELLAQYCGQLAGGILLIGGAATFDVSWQESRLEQLLPVRFSVESRRTPHETPFRLRITPEGLAHPVFQISETADHRSAWSQLPTFQHYAPVDSVKPGGRVWAVAAHPGGNAQAAPILVSQRYGAGLTAVVCTQDLWRWRLARESDPRQFDRFWQQFLRYLGEGSRKNILLALPDQQLQAGRPIRVFLQRRPEPGSVSSPTESYRFSVTDMQKQVVMEQAVELSAGESTEVAFTATDPGFYRLVVDDGSANRLAERSLEVPNVQSEFLRTACDLENLRQWANLSGGAAVRFEDSPTTDALLEQIRASRGQVEHRHSLQRPIGINGWILAILLASLCLEWGSRKRWGLH